MTIQIRPVMLSEENIRHIKAEIANPGTGKTILRRGLKSVSARAERGDLLWAREPVVTDEAEMEKVIGYPADGEVNIAGIATARERDNIKMPRWASRLTLRVESVRTEKLQSSCSREEALEDGFVPEVYDQNPDVIVIQFVPELKHVDDVLARLEKNSLAA